MARTNHPNSRWRSALLGAALCALVGMALDYFPHLGGWLANLSYDLAVVFRVRVPPPDVAIVYMDEQSFDELKQGPQSWNRQLHADLIDRFTREQTKLVVMDVWLRDPGTPAANEKLARAIQANGKVVLAGGMGPGQRPEVDSVTVLPPSSEFQKAAAGWGVSAVGDPVGIVRRFHQGNVESPSLPWAGAALLGVNAIPLGREEEFQGWLNYYGPPGTLPSVSYWEVATTNQPSGYFHDKVVFVGSWRTGRYALDQTDDFRTPHTLVFHRRMPGVEIVATAFLNLLHQDWLSRLALGKESFMVATTGLVLGFSLGLTRPGAALFLAPTLMLGIAFAGVTLTWRTGVWAAWKIPAGAQIPLAVAWSWLSYTKRLRREKESLQEELTRTVEQMTRAETVLASVTEGGPPAIPDHTLLKRVGEGGYGEVWLARNAVGGFHAVKSVHRRGFSSDEPYEREFKGIQNFMPISRSHPGLVHILHVGRKDDAGFFFSIMEVGDDEVTGQQIHPESYSPRTLAKLLERHGALSVEQCVRLGMGLASALEHIHQKRLIHRDIKPANIIYVEGAPKLADIGLVTHMSGGEDGRVSVVGTEGFIAPEGPGTAAADIYSLGKVLYEACMGQDRLRFPELPTAVYDAADYAQRAQLNEIIVRACATRAEERYQSAAELHADLAKRARQSAS